MNCVKIRKTSRKERTVCRNGMKKARGTAKANVGAANRMSWRWDNRRIKDPSVMLSVGAVQVFMRGLIH